MDEGTKNGRNFSYQVNTITTRRETKKNVILFLHNGFCKRNASHEECTQKFARSSSLSIAQLRVVGCIQKKYTDR